MKQPTIEDWLARVAYFFLIGVVWYLFELLRAGAKALLPKRKD